MKCHIVKSNTRVSGGNLYYSGGDVWTDKMDERFIFESTRAAKTRNKLLNGTIIIEQ